MPLMNQADYARHRGCSAPTVQDAKKVRIKPALVERDGKVLIDSDVADRLWDAAKVRNSHKGKGPVAPAALTAPAAGVSPPGAIPSNKDLQAFIQELPEDEIPSIDVSIKRKEHYNAERARLAALMERKEVGSLSEVRTRAAKLARQVRDMLLIIPSRNAARLAAMSDPEDVRALLEQEIEGALKGLKDA
jgi:hypothetical protein